ncbi:glycosyltransferase family 4 protein [Streptosporangium sp. NBC_01756]|uniref:glycosyltransferase family 4 protein n=1 Tax=Streptosporangium sp. NBC_01756 TaxID=2975950 RepID=UPI002DD85213|nr:glycosyltransferase family 4 protein [Streptosporangium sp. NBC_01756]WSC87612.1 glycosyltransferase family 4 protein [Streptosporangium sp. NBC_01756]
MSYRVPPEPGGKERHVECLTREQLRRGHEVTLAFRGGSTVPNGAMVLPLRPTGLSCLLAVKSDVLAFAAEVVGALRNAGPVDLVHLHGDHVEASVIGPFCRKLGIPLVLTVHAALARRHRRLARMALGHVGAFIAIGSRTADDLMDRGADRRRILVASSGIDLGAISGSPPPAREPGLIVSVGSLEPMKNHALLIEAVQALRPANPGLRLLVVGDGPELGRLRRLAGTETGIEFAGQLLRDEVYRQVRRAEVFVLASRRLDGKGEGVPTAALEALALGTPVVVSSDALLDPVVSNRAAYRTFESGSVDDLVRVLRTVLGDEDLRRRMSTLGTQAATALDWPVVAGRFEEWYRVALNAGHPSGALR